MMTDTAQINELAAPIFPVKSTQQKRSRFSARILQPIFDFDFAKSGRLEAGSIEEAIYAELDALPFRRA